MRKTKTITVLTFAAVIFGSTAIARVQASQSDAPAKPKANKQTDSATKNAEDQPKWDPLRAEKDLEVGRYYMRTGNIDAAIDRFNDAILAKPGYAVPFLYLGEAQEKKGMKRDAIKSYTRYLELYPHAEDKEKIEKKIEKLRRESGDKKKIGFRADGKAAADRPSTSLGTSSAPKLAGLRMRPQREREDSGF